MFHHEAKGFGEAEDRVRRFATGIREIRDREKGTVNVVVTVDEKQLHPGKVAESSKIIMIFVGAGTPSCRREKLGSDSSLRPGGRPSPFPAMVAIRIIRA
jgi:hypothetical protein